MADEQRNYAEEAARIVAGESRLLPEKAHLVAMAGHVQSVTSNLQLLLLLLSALMVDNDAPMLVFPKPLLDQATAGFTKLDIKKQPDGSVVVKRQVPPPIARPSVSVN